VRKPVNDFAESQTIPQLVERKKERFFLTLQRSFEQSLVFDKVTSLEQLNNRLWQWIEQVYHQQAHSSLEGQSPAERYRERSDKVRLYQG